MRVSVRLAILAIVPALLGGCDAADRPAPAAAPDAGAPIPVPVPDLSKLEDIVQEQLRQEREALDGLLASSADSASRAEAYGRAGTLYHAYELWVAAEACYENAVRLDPGAFRWVYRMAHLYDGWGKPDRAVETFGRALELRSDDLPTLLHLARIHQEQERFDRAEPLLQRVLEINQASPAARIGLGKIHLARERPAEAVRELEQALRVAPEASEIHYPLGLAYRALGDREQALAHLERRGNRAASFPDPLMEELKALMQGWRVHYHRGTVLFQQGELEGAAEQFRRAVEAAPKEPAPRTNLGTVLSALGDPAGAIEQYRAALEQDPQHAMAHFNLATLLARDGNDAQAVDHYHAALASDPDLLGAHLNLANALRRLGRFEEALPHYQRAVAGDPANPEARLAEILTLARLHRYADAVQRCEEAHAALPEDARLRYVLAVLLASVPLDELRDGPRALALGRQLMQQEMTLQHVVATAMAAAETGDFATAIDLQVRAIEAARGAGRTDLVGEMEANLRRYRDGLACRRPWADDDPALSPAPGSGAVSG